ncbi:MAG TPA: AtpZ/AtpI family protein [Acidimicrobiales bacterium]
MDLVDKRELYNGAGNTLSRAIEMVVVPVVFALIGAWVDRILSTGPLIMILMVLFAVAGLAVRSYYAYGEDMRRQQEGAPWSTAVDQR